MSDSLNRTICFRLTEEEHERFRQLSVSYGLRSVSELARVAMNKYLDEEKPRSTNHELAVRVAELENRIRLLDREVHDLSLSNGTTSS